MNERMALASQRADDFAAEMKKYPTHGASIDYVEPNSPGAKAGLKEMDVVLQVDGVDLPGDLGPMRKDAAQKLTVYHYGQPNRIVIVPPGRLGIGQSAYDPLGLPAFGEVPADPRWNTHMAAFKRFFFLDPAMAEIELNRAIESGLPKGHQTDGWFAELALKQWQFARAMDFAWLAIEGGSKDNEVLDTFHYAGSALCKMQAVSDMLKKRTSSPSGRELENTLEPSIAAWSKLPGEQRRFISPLDESRRLLRWDLNVNGEQRLNSAPGFYDENSPNLSAKKLLFACRFKMRVNEAGPSMFGKFTKFQLNHPGASAGKIVPELSLELYEYLTLVESLRTPMFMKSLVLGANADVERVRELRIGAANGRVECELDRARIFYTFTAEPGEWKIQLGTSGMALDARSIRMDELCTDAEYRAAVKESVNTPFQNGQTRLHREAACGHIAEARILLDMGANPAAMDKNSHTPAQLAAQMGDVAMLKLLTAKTGVTDEVVAGALGDRDAVVTLAAAAAPGPGKNLSAAWPALHGAAAAGQVELVRELLARGTDINLATSDAKETALMWAARTGQSKVCELLRSRGADATHRDSRNQTAADHARWSGFEKLSTSLALPPAPVKPPAPPNEF
ncbi:MAG TPA: ankyrin repeat domain-containing protein [Planctomycetota bacterium]|nr:ankyrin repeat domain-containing protein [Planctomycetota bacterium]